MGISGSGNPMATGGNNFAISKVFAGINRFSWEDLGLD